MDRRDAEKSNAARRPAGRRGEHQGVGVAAADRSRRAGLPRSGRRASPGVGRLDGRRDPGWPVRTGPPGPPAGPLLLARPAAGSCPPPWCRPAGGCWRSSSLWSARSSSPAPSAVSAGRDGEPRSPGRRGSLRCSSAPGSWWSRRSCVPPWTDSRPPPCRGSSRHCSPGPTPAWTGRPAPRRGSVSPVSAARTGAAAALGAGLVAAVSRVRRPDVRPVLRWLALAVAASGWWVAVATWEVVHVTDVSALVADPTLREVTADVFGSHSPISVPRAGPSSHSAR